MEAFLFWDGNSSVGEEVLEKTLLFHVRREMAQSQNCAIRLDMNMFQKGSTLLGGAQSSVQSCEASRFKRTLPPPVSKVSDPLDLGPLKS